jgi:hypothetical protein
MARWRRELADFYCRSGVAGSKSKQPGEVTQVAFEATTSATSNRDAAYWRLVRDKTDQWIAEAEASLAAKQNTRGRAPVQLGPVEMSGIGLAGNLMSILIAAMLATGFCLWSMTSPAIELRTEDDHAVRSSFAGSVGPSNERIEVAIPAEWVRINQPTSVKLRRVAVAIIVFGAIAIQLKAITGV